MTSQRALDIEALMDKLGCTGTRIRESDIKNKIINVDFETIDLAGQTFMFCGIRMDNGFVAVGKPATCIDPANWRDEIGQKIAFENALEPLWQLEAYRLMSDRIKPTET